MNLCFWIPFLWLLLAALLGGLIGWLLRNGRKTNSHAVVNHNANNTYLSEIDGLKKNRLDLENDKNRLQTDFDSLKLRLAAAQNRPMAQAAPAPTKVEDTDQWKLQTQNHTRTIEGYNAKISNYDSQVSSLKAELAAALLAANAASSSLLSSGINLRNPEEMETERQDILARIRTRAGEVDLDRIGAFSAETGKKDNLKRLRGLNEFTEKKLNAVGIYTFKQVSKLTADDQKALNVLLELPKNKFQKEEWVFQSKRLLGMVSDELPEVILTRIGTKQSELDYNRIGGASAANKDNLQLIQTISAYDEAKLNALGIYKFAQIANFNRSDVKLVNELIEIEEGKIRNEEWVKQAENLNKSANEATLSRIRGRQDQVNWERIGRVADEQREDLQVISGIGLFIEEKLYALGLNTIEQISKIQTEDAIDLNNILELTPGHIQGDEWVSQAKKIIKK